jgi:hypothetical protein
VVLNQTEEIHVSQRSRHQRRLAGAANCRRETDSNGIRSMTIEKVKLIVVRQTAPDVEVQLGIFPSKEAALPEFKELIAKGDTLRAAIDPIEGERTEANSACYQQSTRGGE